MNIRKKILFNPSHLKSVKPDTSDTTTAHTKNSSILQQSKTFRFSNQKTISTRRQRNYLRTLSKDPKDKDLSYNHVSVIKKKNIIIPSFSTMSNENFMPIRKSVLGRNFLVEQDELPPLVALKRTDLMTSQQQRKLFNYPSSVHVSSNKEIFMREEVKKQSQQQQKQQTKQSKPDALVILGQQVQEIERRKQKLNSLNVASFYTTQKSIALSKYSIKSRQNNMERRINSDKKSSECGEIYRDDKMSRFTSVNEQRHMQVDEVKQSPQRSSQEPDEQLEESIVEEIEKNQSQAKENLIKKKPQENTSNEWSETLKSSFTDSSNKDQQNAEDKVCQNENNERNNDSNEESSLCQSEVINSQQVEERKKTHRKSNTITQNHVKDRSGQESMRKQNMQKSSQQMDEESSLCESYQVETPQKREN